MKGLEKLIWMQSDEDNYDKSYEIYEDKKAIKFMDKINQDTDLKDRIQSQYLNLSVDSYKVAEGHFQSKKCPKCKKTRVGNYRIIYFIHELKKTV